MTYSSKPARFTRAGRATIARAVAVDHDWALPASSADRLIEALDDVSADDLEAAYWFGYHLRDAASALLIRMHGLPPVRRDGEPGE